MTEAEFLAVFRSQVELDEARAEAQARAMREG